MRHVILALVALLLTAYVQTAAQSAAEPADEASCVQAGGRWARGGMRGTPVCYRDYPDAGAACTRADDCQGRCIVQADGTGQCQKARPQFGCYRFLDRQGHAIGLCAD